MAAATAAASVCSVAFAGCGTGPTAGPVEVVAGENFWGNIAGQVGGPAVRVRSIISDPSADPHLYESDAADAAAVGRARIVVENGAGYDDFLTRLVAATPTSARTVLSVQHLLGAPNDANPHFWYDVSRVRTVAAGIEAALAHTDPAHAAGYQLNLTRFDQALTPLLAALSDLHQRFPGAPVAYTERLPGYLLADAGLKVLTPAGFASAVEDGNEPSPADTAAMDDLITGHRLRVLLYNAQTTTPVTDALRRLAQRAGVAVVPVTETLPPGEPTYQAWQLAEIKAIAAGLAAQG